jgi:hypothetical protein
MSGVEIYSAAGSNRSILFRQFCSSISLQDLKAGVAEETVFWILRACMIKVCPDILEQRAVRIFNVTELCI